MQVYTLNYCPVNHMVFDNTYQSLPLHTSEIYQLTFTIHTASHPLYNTTIPTKSDYLESIN